MSAATSLSYLHDAWQSAVKTLPVPSSGAVIDQEGKAFAKLIVGSGTYLLPDGGTPFFATATGTAIFTTEAGTTVATLTSATGALFVPLTDTTWAAQTFKVGVSPATADLPNAQYSTSSTVTSLTPAAGVLTGARHVFFQNTADGAVEVITRTGTQLFGDIIGAYVGLRWLLTIVNRGNNTVTLTGGEDVTVNGEATIATLTTRTYVCELFNTTSVTMQAVDKGTIET